MRPITCSFTILTGTVSSTHESGISGKNLMDLKDMMASPWSGNSTDIGTAPGRRAVAGSSSRGRSGAGLTPTWKIF